jgi:hypothetical protein
MAKQLLAALLLFSTQSLIAQTKYPGNIPGCVARYNFTSTGTAPTLIDASSNNNSGTTYNLAPASGYRGIPNSAMKFDGLTSYAKVTHAANLSPQQVTQIALVKFDGFNSGSCQISQVLTKGVPYNAGVYGMGISDNVYDNDCAGFDPTHQMRLDYVGATPPVTPQSAPIQSGAWYFMVSSYDGVTWKAYQTTADSTNLLGSITPMMIVPNNSPLGYNAQDLFLGKANSTSYPYWFNGVMDEVALFNRVLTDQAIYKIYYFLVKGFALGAPDAQKNPSVVEGSIANGQLHLLSLDGEKIGEVALLNMQGQVLSSKVLNNNTADLDVRNLPKGILLLKVAHKGIITTLKVTNL